MALYKWEGTILRVGGALAKGLDCCCSCPCPENYCEYGIRVTAVDDAFAGAAMAELTTTPSCEGPCEDDDFADVYEPSCVEATDNYLRSAASRYVAAGGGLFAQGFVNTHYTCGPNNLIRTRSSGLNTLTLSCDRNAGSWQVYAFVGATIFETSGEFLGPLGWSSQKQLSLTRESTITLDEPAPCGLEELTCVVDGDGITIGEDFYPWQAEIVSSNQCREYSAAAGAMVDCDNYLTADEWPTVTVEIFKVPCP